ncbi:Nitrogen regulation protein C [Slackia heliotrinireducens]|uniref:Response regulator containing a CheY-like receiver domain and an HTH DNA-binding domain n=1 Tax=Slackia heliotrinireducens (strain ATCC 29202 / DSM 20476 / NCTC 11029 / RHS 1) TaxID=471855 RepID=C7N2J8_SLAHD|nr:LuxR C-terminal-related transcriptional regulator [Slackia heliotrinireducens]ACV23506.1 response regulator containing a CheY-like receiver domain and an HTH DNA-binding domain [Slackia heliotrinireducens DSM 20476]VEH02876.1 Nitrogen regulation protein C [Slackia heliotrinireducens]
MIQRRAEIPWEKIYDYVMMCGSIHNPVMFVRAVLDEIDDLVPYEQGIAMCLDENRRVCDQYLVNMKTRWMNMYIEYYSRLSTTKWNLSTDVSREEHALPHVQQIMWEKEPITEFIANYIMVRGVKCSLAIALFDQSGMPRAAFSLDRTQQSRFTDREVEIVRHAMAQIGNLYKNFFTDPRLVPGMHSEADTLQLDRVLTKRELEVVNLLTQGLSASHVAATLHITVSTAYKHIAHIYKKLNVSSQQELLVRVLGNR